MIEDTNVINFDYDPNQKPPSIIDMLKRLKQVALEYAKNEEEKMKSPDWRYERIHIASKEIAEIMLSPDTPLEIKRQLEWATFIGYQWVHKDESSVFVDERIK